LTDELRAKFDSDDEKLLEFEAVLEAAQQFAPIKEAHARLQLVGTGSLRVPCLALVRKLKATGLVEDVDDVFYLHLREFQEIADDEPVQNMKAIIAERRANREKWQNIVPPAFEGVAPVRSGNPSSDDYEESREDQPDLLRGLAASKGIVSGRATVVRTLEEGSRLEEGAILVCHSTSPSWTPLIARASVVVTDTGGVLAHMAIVAREFGIPCVVGTGNTTSIIVDGTYITVDGGEGTVRGEK
jgi:pyruvate,water dikinase